MSSEICLFFFLDPELLLLSDVFGFLLVLVVSMFTYTILLGHHGEDI